MTKQQALDILSCRQNLSNIEILALDTLKLDYIDCVEIVRSAVDRGLEAVIKSVREALQLESTHAEKVNINLEKQSTLIIDTPKTCGECPLCIFTAEEKRYIGYCHTSDDDYYCKALDRFMEYDEVDGGYDIFGKAPDCPLKEVKK